MTSREPVAIVGLGGVFPGAPTLEQFWDVVEQGRDATQLKPPAGRWVLDPTRAFAPGGPKPDRVYALRGGFIEGFVWDPTGLAIAPEDAERLDPMVHLALHAGRQAWSGAQTQGLDRSRVGVVLGNIALPTTSTSAMA
ncbi:MAG: beta-ketoacyl synthase N-terminal-like domain-containing protein, partial [Myxococcota bacterium]